MNHLCFGPLLHLIARRLAVAGLVMALGWLAEEKVFAGGGPQNVLVVVNGSSQSSLEVANEYQRLRNIPERNVFYLQSSNTAAFYTGGDLRRIMTSASFRTNCLWPVLNYIRSNGMTNHIDYILYSTDIPTRIDVTSETGGSTEYYSITAMTQFGDLVEPVNMASMAVNSVASFRGFTYVSGSPSTYTTNFTHARVWGTISSLPQRFYISTVLGWTHWFGNTTEELKNYLARSRNADGTRPTGTVYLDANVDVRGTTRSGRFLGTSNELAGLGIPSMILTGNPSPYSITNKPDILGAMMGAASPEVPAGSYYLPGSIAESLTSWSGIMDNTGIGQFRMSQHLGVGVAGTSGTVTEPFAIESKFPTSRMHAHYARGATLGEAFQFSVWTPYHLLIMGDALCRPGAIIPTVTLTNLTEGDVVTGSRTLFPGASTAFANGLAGFDLFLDGLPWQTAPTNGSVTLNTTTLADGGHELRVIAYENSAIRTQGDRVVNFRVNNSDEQLLFDSTNYTSTVGGTNILLTVTRAGVITGQVDLWKGPTRLGSLSGTSSNASISVTNFGSGRSILRATMAMTSGNVRSEPILVDVLPAADSTPPTIARFSIQTGTNNQMQGLSSKPAYRSGDYIYLSIVPSEPISLTNLLVKVGGGTSKPFPISWVGMSSTNVIPNLAGLTNPMIYRYQLLNTRDAEGQLPVVFSLRDAAGNTNIVTNNITTDYTPPDLQSMYVTPSNALPGATVTINCLMTELLATNATVLVGGNAATYLSSNGNWQTFSYTVPLNTTPGTNFITVTNLIDLAGNTGAVFTITDNFELRTNGAKISSYNPPWTTYTNASTTPTWIITNTPVAPGSTKSLGLMDAPSVAQLCYFQLGGSHIGANLEFDVYLENRNPSGNAQLVVFGSIDGRSLRELEIACNQTTGSAWQLEVRNPSFTTVLATNLSLQTWYHVQYANDVRNKLWSAWLNGTALGLDVPYTAPYPGGPNNFAYLANFTISQASNDEDVYLDNVSAFTSYTRPTLVISGYADTWTGNTSGSWGTDLNWTNVSGGTSYADGDAVIFDDTLYKNPTITNATPGAVVSPGLMVFNNNRTNYVIHANIGGPGSLTKSGSAWLTLTGSNSFSGGLVLNAGTVLLPDGTGRIANAAPVTLAGGTLALAGTVSETAGVLTVGGPAGSAIDFGSGAAILTFTNSSAAAWAGSLQILNWSGSTNGGGTDRLFFGATAGGLTAGQLTRIVFSNPAGTNGNFTATILGTGEVAPNLNQPYGDTWKQTATGTYDWNIPTNWVGGVSYPNGIDAVANVATNIGGAQTINLNTNITVGKLNLGDNASTFYNTTIGSNTANGTLTFDVSNGSAWLLRPTNNTTSADAINANVGLNQPLQVFLPASSSAVNSITVNGAVNGAVNGTGGITLVATNYNSTTSDNLQLLDLANTNNSFSGPVEVANGVIAFRGSVLKNQNSALGNSTGAIRIGSPLGATNNNSASAQYSTTTTLRLKASDDTSNHIITRDLDFSSASNYVSSSHPGRVRFEFAGNGDAGTNYNTLTLGGVVTLANSNRATCFLATGQGMTIYFTNQIQNGLGSASFALGMSTIPSSNPSLTDGPVGGTYRFSNYPRTFSAAPQVTIGTVIIEGNVPATGASPIGASTSQMAMSDGNGGNILMIRGETARRAVFLATPGATNARGATFSGGSTGTAYGGTNNFNVFNSYQIGGVNTNGTVMWSGPISFGTVNVGSNGTPNYVSVGANLALLAATGGTASFTGVISDVPTNTASTNNLVTRVTVNQVRNHPNLDTNADAIIDTTVANQPVGTPTAGTVILGAGNTYEGGTEVLGGTLLVTNLTGSATGIGDVLVTNGATLGGSGRIAGKVIFAAGTFATNTAGSSLTLSNSVTLNGNTINVGALTALGAGDYLLLTNTAGGISGSFASVTVGGAGLATGTTASVVTTANGVWLQASATTTLQLFSSANPSTSTSNVTFTATVLTNGATAVSASGNIVFKVDGTPVATNAVASGAAAFATSTLAMGTHLMVAEYSGAANYLPSTNTLSQVVNAAQTLPATGTNITFEPVSGNTFKLAWPTNYIGWQLQSNAVDVTLTNYWFLVPGSTNTNSVTIMISPALTNVFYRMQHP